MSLRWFAAALLAVWTLVSAVAVAGPADTLRVVVIADLNGSYRTVGYGAPVEAAIARILALRPDLVLIAGDMVAGQLISPPLSGPELRRMWNAFDATVARPLERAGIPLAVAPGNHDASSRPEFASERAAYVAHWRERKPPGEPRRAATGPCTTASV